MAASIGVTPDAAIPSSTAASLAQAPLLAERGDEKPAGTPASSESRLLVRSAVGGAGLGRSSGTQGLAGNRPPRRGARPWCMNQVSSAGLGHHR